MEGFIHKGRIVSALMYLLDDGSRVVVWLDRAGNSTTPTRPAEPGKVMVTVKPGEWVVSCTGERRQVVSVEVWRSLPVVPPV